MIRISFSKVTTFFEKNKRTVVYLAFIAAVVALVALASHLHTLHLLLLTLSLFCFTGFLATSRLAPSSVFGVTNSVVFVLYALTTAGFFAANYFTGSGITFDVVTQLNSDTLGAGFYAFEIYHKLTLLVLAFFAIIYLIEIFWFRAGVDLQAKPFYVASIILMFALHPLVTTTGSMFLVLNKSAHAETVLQVLETNRLTSEEILNVRSELPDLPNVLLVFLESFERTYFDDRYYEGLLTDMEDLTSEGQDFTNVIMPWGATHTIAGMVASLCGVPINSPRGGKHQHGKGDVFMPQAQCLNDVTRELGYNNVFYQGARLSFTNKGGFMRAHGYKEVKGLKELKDAHDPVTGVGPWGLHDDVLIDKVEKRLDELMDDKSGYPFFFTTLSLDTHDAFGKNRYSRSCVEQGIDNYGEADHGIQHAVYCSDKLLSSFINRVRKKWGEDLLVVMMSDHAAYPFNVGDRLREADERNHRRLIFTIFEHDKEPVQFKRDLSSLDLGATLLGYLTGNRLNTIGLGLSAFDESRKNLVERLGPAGLDLAMQSSNVELGKVLWKLASFSETDLRIDMHDQSVSVGSDRYSIPVGLLLDEAGTIVDFYEKDVHEKLSLLKVSPRLIWVGKCKYTATLFPGPGGDSDTCLIIGNAYGNNYHYETILNSKTLHYKDYLENLEPDSDKQDIGKLNQRLYQYTGPKSIFETVEITPSGATGDTAIIDIHSTMGANVNLVRYTMFPTMEERLDLDKESGTQYGFPNDSGFYLLEIQDGQVNVVHHWKTCTGKITESDLPVSELMEKYNDSAALVLVSARETRCENDPLDLYFENSPFKAAASLQRRQPFVAYLEKGALQPVIATGAPGENVQLRLINRELFEKQ